MAAWRSPSPTAELRRSGHRDGVPPTLKPRDPESAPMKAVLSLLLVLALTAGCFGSGRDDDATPAPATTELAPPVPPGAYRFEDFARVLADGALERLPREILYIPSEADGIDIEITLWRPDTDEPVPVLADAGPYYEPAGAV